MILPQSELQAATEELAPPMVMAVDDDPTVLSALRRLLRPEGIQLLTASSGDEALLALEEHGDALDVLISDYAMPGMDGAELLRNVRARWPEVTRVLLTGNADLPAAARAVNEGQLSHLCTKPWQPEEFRLVVLQAIDQRRMLRENRQLRLLADQQAVRLEDWNQRLEAQVAERTAELQSANISLNKSLLETVRLLTTVLAQRLPEHAARCREVARLAGRLAERAALPPDEVRRIQVAALVHDIGLLGLSQALTIRVPSGLPMAGRIQYQQHAEIGYTLLSSVERLTDIAGWIRHHHERWDGNGYPDRLSRIEIPMPSRIIGLAAGYIEASAARGGIANWLRLQREDGAYDPDLVDLLERELRGDAADVTYKLVELEALQPGMVLLEDVRATTGTVILAAGHALSAEQVARVVKFAASGGLEQSEVSVLTMPA
jgi:response regulator RpfG family c-di-GMP phosphodiesterase